MKVMDLKGYYHSWNLNGYVPNRNSTRPRSDLHVNARKLLKEIFPSEMILEEVSVPGERLFLDFFLPLRKIIVEVHGEQHYKYISYFYKSPIDFANARKNDERKKEWSSLNNFELIVFKYDEGIDEWKRKIS